MAGLTLGNILSAVKLASLLVLVAALLWYRHSATTWHLAFDKLKTEYIAASQMAAWKQLAANSAIEARYSAKAQETDLAHQANLSRAERASAGYIAAHRLRTGNQCAPSGTTAAAESAGAGVSENAAADAFVAVSTADVRACTDAAVYAMAAHQWAASLGE